VKAKINLFIAKTGDHMSVSIVRKNVIFQPDSRRVIARFFDHGNIKAPQIIKRILDLSEKQQKAELSHVLRRYAKRHRNILKIFDKHFLRTEPV
jgi:ribosomal protein S28E/S33